MHDLQEQVEVFSSLVERAFDADFRTALMGSVEMARTVGVKESEILKTVDEIDEFFM